MKRTVQSLFGWQRGLAYTLLLGVVMGALEGIAPTGAIYAVGSAESVRMLATIPGWICEAAVIVLTAAWGVPRFRPHALAAITVALVVGFTVIRAATPTGPLLFPIQASAWYLGWVSMLYGALFVGAHALAFRADRTRGLLAQAEVARGRSETLFAQAELAGLHGLVDPAFVLRVLGEIQRRYAADAAQADSLLDQLVAFLRLAMPAVRSGRSTLGAELALSRSYMSLCAAVEPLHADWACEVDGALDDVPFPPLLLLAVIDALAMPATRALRITARSDDTLVELSLHGAAPGSRVPDAMLHRLRVGLHALHGPAAHVGASADAVLTIGFPRADQAHRSHPQPPGGPPPWTHPLATKTN
jgi:hypothetical protein